MTERTNDPWDAARDAEPRPLLYWGNLQADAHFVVLEKGIGRLPFDESVHPEERRLTAVKLSLLPIAEQQLDFPIERDVIAEFGEWLKIIQPSILALGVEPRELNDRFVKVRMVPTGRTYRNDRNELVDATTFKFLKLFADENECIQDYMSGAEEEEEEPVAQIADPQQATAPAQEPTDGKGASDKEKETALTFLKLMVDNAVDGQTELPVIQETLAASLEQAPFVEKHFKADSPETLQLIAEAMEA
jgi:hypothetical protein